MAKKSGFSGLEQFDDVVKNLRSMSKEIEGKVEDKALKAGAELLKEKIESHPNVPVSDDGSNHARDNFIVKKVEDGRYDIGISEDHFYLLFHEVGAKGGTYEVDGRSYTTPDIPAKPFMRPALENNKEEVQRAMAKIIKKELGL